MNELTTLRRQSAEELSLAVDDVVLASMRRHTPGMVTVLRTLIRVGETDERILERCREFVITPQTYRNVGHALAALRREGATRPDHSSDHCTGGEGEPA